MSENRLGELVQTAGTSLAADQSGSSWLGSRWYEQLQPGSWRGVGFVMDAAETHAGRRTAVHEYPYRDTVWVEDLGRLPRRFNFQAFLVGDDCYQQRAAMMQACEQPGSGTLVHPTLGSVECVLIDFTTTDRRERGRVVECSFQFVVSGDILFPDASQATGSLVNSSASSLFGASSGDLGRVLGGVGIISDPAVLSIGGYAKDASSIVNDATRMLSAVNGLQGFYGRYSSGNRSSLQSPATTVQSALAQANSTRHDVINAVEKLQTVTQGLL